MMENKVCKKCHRDLSDGYKYDKCEACRNKATDDFKKGLKATLGALGAVASVVVLVATKGKIEIKK